jgi:hypothetical protein
LTHVHPNCLEQRDGQLVWQGHAKVSPELATLIDKMICPDLADRYPTATAALADLQNLPEAPPEIPEPEPQYPARKKGVWLALLGTIGIASAVWGIDRHLSNSTTPKLQEESLHF